MPLRAGLRAQCLSSRSHALPLPGELHSLYNQMLRLLTQAWGRQNADVSAKRALLEAAMSVMGALSGVSAHLATLPARESEPGVNAGITFAIFRAVEPLCEGPAEWRITAERLAELGAGMRAVCGGVAELEKGASKLEDLAKGFAAGVG